jgi:hypothetical protein
VSGQTGPELERRLADRGYRAYRVARRLEPGLAGASGLFNAFFKPG